MAEQMIQAISGITNRTAPSGAGRVVCLYRVSTVGQVEKDDIPMQKQYCREFCKQHPGWEIIKEFSEKGVSGFKKSAKDRDAISELQKLALQGGFDILLVFMFDRLGRKDDETSFVVEWFVKQNIEVSFEEFQSLYLEPEEKGRKRKGAGEILALAECVG